MNTDSDHEGADGHDDEVLRARCDSAYVKAIRLAGRFRDLDELTAVAGLRELLIDMGPEVGDLATGLAVFAVRAQREHSPFEGHPVAVAAEKVLDAEIRGDTRAAAQIAGAALKIHPHGVPIMVITWVRAYERHATGGRVSVTFDPQPMLVVAGLTGAQLPEDEWPPGVRWTVAVIRAYMVEDADAFDRLLGEVTRDTAAVLLAALTQSVAYTINGMPQGWALMGDTVGGRGA